VQLSNLKSKGHVLIDQYGDSNKALRYKREENSATQTQAGMVMLVSISNKKIMNEMIGAIDVTGGFNVVSQTSNW
jgi:hypothetical protein